MQELVEIIKILTDQKKTISTMESCTGGGLANAITNISGASEVFKFGAVTYSNEFKIKMGVNKETIDKYTVYSKQVAREMAKTIKDFTNSTIGIGITGKLKKIDNHNLVGKNDEVFIAIYFNKKYTDLNMQVNFDKREDNKNEVIEKIAKTLLELLK